MFEPGHLHHASPPGPAGQPAFSVDIHYEVRRDAQEGLMLHFRMLGEVAGKTFEEAFELHRDTAYNFASVASRLAAKHGLHPDFGPILRDHEDFDNMFEDIRAKLDAHSGDPVDLDHLYKDGL